MPTIIDDEIIKLAKADGITLKPEKERKFRLNNEQRVPYIELFDSANVKLPIENGAFLRQCLNSEINYTTSRALIEVKDY